MNKKAIIICFVLSLVFPMRAISGGIPVVDVVSIAESIRAYVQQLKDYKELISQTTGIDDQYIQMVVDYNQTLQEYGKYLNQIKGLEASISAGDWSNLTRRIAVNYGSFDPGLIATLDPSLPAYANNVRAILQAYNLAPRLKSAVLTDYTTLGAHSLGTDKTKGIEADFDTMNKEYERYANQQEIVAHNVKELGDVMVEKANLQTELRGLGAESDLQTLQLMATQQAIAINQQDVMAKIANASLQNYESFSSFRNAGKNKYYKNELKRLGNSTSSPIGNGSLSNFSTLGL